MPTETHKWESTGSELRTHQSSSVKTGDYYYERRLPLEGGGYVVVSPEDERRLRGYTWKKSSHGYAYRLVENSGRTEKRYMHREIMNEPLLHVDHVNGDKLDNRRCNLRVVTPQQNQFNSRKKAPALSRYKGVTRQNGRWVARITMNRTTKYLGSYCSEEEAAKAYDEVARHLFGEFACANFN